MRITDVPGRALLLPLILISGLGRPALAGGALGAVVDTGVSRAFCTRSDTKQEFILEINFNSGTVRANWEEEDGGTYLRTFAGTVSPDMITWTTGHETKFTRRGRKYDEIDTWTLDRKSGDGVYVGDGLAMVKYYFHCRF